MNKILIVDDIATNRKLLKNMLGVLKIYEVIEADDGDTAIVQSERENPDLILMDVNMPKMNGYESAAKIKEVMGDNYIPIIFVTALSQESSLADAIHSGGDDFISKPFTLELLNSKITAHLRIRELNQQLNENNKTLTQLNQNLQNEQELVKYFFDSALQKSFLDKNIIHYHMSPMSVFSGDILLAARGPSGGLYVVMGDFTGHGLTAAMGTLPLAMVFFKMAKLGKSISEIASEINKQLKFLLPTGMFLGASLFELNPRGNILSVWMGGMPDNYWLDANGKLKGVIKSKYMPLGILGNSFDATVEIYSVEKGDKIYLHSDGINEAKNSADEIFGDARILAALLKTKSNRVEKVLNDLREFTGVDDQNDDITLVEITCDAVAADNAEEESVASSSIELPWHVAVTITAKEMRSKGPISKLSDFLASIPLLTRHKGVLHVLLTEMYSNALDHSILQLQSVSKVDEKEFENYYKIREEKLNGLTDDFISFDFKLDINIPVVYVEMRDSGVGYKNISVSGSDEQLHGRGLGIINDFCEDVTFSDGGKTLQVTYKL